MSNPRRSVPLFGLILGVILILSGQTTAQNITVSDWWENTITYQVWTRSFQDSNGDGIGDLQGVINRLDHFEELGVETIWLNTIYPSPLSNSGFDLSDYENVDSVYGSLEDFDALVAAAHNRGLKVILDFIPNHSSVDHPWFNASVYRVDPYTDYYIWQNGTLDASGNRIPPNNWVRISSNDEEESAWNWNPIRQQWYLHQFTTDEADLNLRNDAVIGELLNVLDFWLNRDVDGFYIHGVPYFLEDENLTDNPTGTSDNSFGLEENVNLLHRFREHVNSWASLNDNETKFLVAEGFENDEKLMAYYGNDTNEGVAPLNIHFISEFNSTSNASYIKSRIDSWISALPSSQTTNWRLSTQDYSRITNRYGLNRADGINMFVLTLPGRVFTYYGEEIAMLDNRDISYTDTIDSEACEAGESSFALISRDPYRTPMQWDSTANAGFTNSSSPYLPVHVAYSTRNVESQLASESSNIKTYKAVAALRSTPTFVYGSYEIEALNDDRVLVLRRSLDNYPTYILVINLGLGRVTVNLTEVFTDLQDTLNIAVLSSNGVLSGTTVNTGDFLLTANAAVLLTDAEDDGIEEEVETLTTEAESEVTTTEVEQSESTTTEVAENEVTTTEIEESESTTTEVEGNIMTTTIEAEQNESMTTEIEEKDSTEATENEDKSIESTDNAGFTILPTVVGLFFSLCFSLVSFYRYSY